MFVVAEWVSVSVLALVFCRPHGHGDVHSLLHLSGTVKTWLSKGLTHMFIFQDTNFTAPCSGLVGLGVCTQHDFDMCSLCVPRLAGEAIGGICSLKGEGKPDITINVEYNQIDALLRSTEEYKDGDVNQADTGFSLWPGNINELIFKLSSYDQTLERSGGQVPEFVNPKYSDEAKTKFKSPTRLECMMQDFPRCDHAAPAKLRTIDLRIDECIVRSVVCSARNPVSCS